MARSDPYIQQQLIIIDYGSALHPFFTKVVINDSTYTLHCCYVWESRQIETGKARLKMQYPNKVEQFNNINRAIISSNVVKYSKS